MAPAPKPSVTSTPEKASSKTRLLIPVAVLLFAIAGAAYFAWQHHAQETDPILYFPGEQRVPKPLELEHVPSQDGESLRSYRIVGEVPRLAWNPDRPFTLWAIEQDRPVILTNSAVHRWPALRKWTPQYLAANSRHLPLEFKTAGDPVFIYSQRKALNRVEGIEFMRPFNLTQMDLETFWNRVSGQQDNIDPNERYLYFTGCLSRSQDGVRRFHCPLFSSRHR